MPNQGNRSNGSSHSGKGAPRNGTTSKGAEPKPNPERSDVKHSDDGKGQKGDTSRSSNQGRKTASGGS